MDSKNLRTETVQLESGFNFGGTLHKEVTIREEILSDNFREAIEIEETFGEDSFYKEEKDSETIKACVQFRRRVVKIGEIPEEDLKKLTAEDYLNKLSSVDYMKLLGTKVKLDKKIEQTLLESAETEEERAKRLEKEAKEEAEEADSKKN